MGYKELDTELQYKVFEWLRFPLIVGVVFIHSFGSHYDYGMMDFNNLTTYDFYNLFRICISHVLTHISVPTFFFISGYLFFHGLESWDKKIYYEKLKRRIKTLVIPFLIWNTLSVLLFAIGTYRQEGWIGLNCFLEENGYWRLYWDCKNLSVGQVNWLGASIISTSPYLIPLWYIRDLIVVSMCAPLLYYLFEKIKGWFLLLLVICYVSGVFVNISGFSSMAFLFFGAGAYFKIYNIDLITVSYKYHKPIMIISVFLIMVLTILDGQNTRIGNIIYPFYIIIGTVNIINVAIYFVKYKKCHFPQLLSSGAFFIYLSHKVVIMNKLSNFIASHFKIDSPLSMTISYMLLPILTIICCLLLYYLLNRFTPRLCRLIMGGR